MKRKQPVLGVHAAPPRPTARAAFLLAVVLSLPFVLLAAIEWIWL